MTSQQNGCFLFGGHWILWYFEGRMHQRGSDQALSTTPSSQSQNLSHNWIGQDPDLNLKCQEGGTGPCTTVLCNTTVEAGVIIRHGRTGGNRNKYIYGYGDLRTFSDVYTRGDQSQVWFLPRSPQHCPCRICTRDGILHQDTPQMDFGGLVFHTGWTSINFLLALHFLDFI